MLWSKATFLLATHHHPRLLHGKPLQPTTCLGTNTRNPSFDLLMGVMAVADDEHHTSFPFAGYDWKQSKCTRGFVCFIICADALHSYDLFNYLTYHEFLRSLPYENLFIQVSSLPLLLAGLVQGRALQ